MRKQQVVIIGGGAAGLAAAVSAARCGAQVTIVEHMDRVGKKILSTGNGRCNMTNLYMEPECYRSCLLYTSNAQVFITRRGPA